MITPRINAAGIITKPHTPKRNGENGYRDYSEEDVAELKKIKLLRKLSLPIEEIRKIQSGALVLEDALMRQVCCSTSLIFIESASPHFLFQVPEYLTGFVSYINGFLWMLSNKVYRESAFLSFGQRKQYN